MKPITGTVLSSKAVSLKKCASVLSRFVASDTGAQQDVLGFLKRTSEAATELVQYYRGLSSSKEDSGAEIPEEINIENIEEEEERKKSKKKKKSKKERKEEEAAESIRVYENGDAVDVVDLKMEKTSRRKERRVGDEMEEVEGKSAEGESIVEERKSKRKDKKKKKKRKDEEEASELTEDVDEAREELPRVKKRKC